MKNTSLLRTIFCTHHNYWTALLAVMFIFQTCHASDSWDEEGERRAKSAGVNLVGNPAPDVTLTSIDGNAINLGDLYSKKPIYLKFWTTWCVPCRQQMPGFVEIHKEFGNDLEVIAINTGFADTATAVRAYRKEHKLTMPIVIDDGSLASALNIRVTPQHVVIDRSGVISHVGHLDNKELHTALQNAVVEESKVRVSTAKLSGLTAYKVGDQVNDLKLSLLDGTEINLAKPDVNPRALVFFAPWCEWYLAESLPEISKACQRVLGDAERLMWQDAVEWVGVSSGLWVTESDLVEYKKSSKRDLPLVHDANDSLFQAFGIRDIPSIVLLDAKGRVAKILGPDDTNLEEAITALK